MQKRNNSVQSLKIHQILFINRSIILLCLVDWKDKIKAGVTVAEKEHKS